MDKKQENVRLFIGSYADFSIIDDECANKISQHFACPIKFVEQSKIHLTWKFLGEVSHIKVPEIRNIVEESVQKVSEISIHFNRFEIWPSGKNPSLIVLTGEDLNGNATAFHQKLDKKLEKLGIKREKRKFKPHLTFARFRLKHRPAEKFILPEWFLFKEQQVGFSDISIIESRLTPQGSVYNSLKKFSI